MTSDDSKYEILPEELKNTYQEKPGVLIIIGLTQSGKSLLCNYLFNDKFVKDFPCASGKGHESKTTKPKTLQVLFRIPYNRINNDQTSLFYHTYPIKVLDTPGIGDTNDDDEEHMREFLIELQKFKKAGIGLSTILLVFKFKTLLDDRYLKLIIHYKKMMPELFNKSLKLVITDCKLDKNWVEEQKLLDIDIKKECEMIRDKIQNALKLTYELSYHTINTVPVAKEDKVNSSSVRDNILDGVGKTKPLDVTITKFPKTLKWIAEDEKEIAMLDSRVEGMSKAMVMLNNDSSKIAAKYQKLLTKQDITTNSIEKLRSRLNDIDNEMLYTIHESNHFDTWHYFSRASSNVDVKTTKPIRSYQVNGGSWEGDIGTHDAKGKILKGLWSTLNATLYLYTQNRDQYCDEIKEIKALLNQLLIDKGKNDEDINLLLEEKLGNQKTMNDLKDELKTINNKRKVLKKDPLSMEEASIRLMNKD